MNLLRPDFDLDIVRLEKIKERNAKGLRIARGDIKILLDNLGTTEKKLEEANLLIEEMTPFIGNVLTDIHYVHILTPLRIKLDAYLRRINVKFNKAAQA